MRVIGLTGGTGSGKSTVSAYLKKRGCCIIDADEIARQLTSPGGEALDPIREKFGDYVFYDNGILDRKNSVILSLMMKKSLKSLRKLPRRLLSEKLPIKFIK